MIDQFYDHRIRIIMTSQTDVDHLFDKVFNKEKEIESKLNTVSVRIDCNDEIEERNRFDAKRTIICYFIVSFLM